MTTLESIQNQIAKFVATDSSAEKRGPKLAELLAEAWQVKHQPSNA